MNKKKDLLDVFEGKKFNVDEAKKIAIALERTGFRFYSAMKDRVQNERVHTVFAKMAEEERKHVSDIEAMLDDPDSEWYLDPSMEEMVLRYFEDYMEGGVFPSGPEAEAATMTLADEVQAVSMAHSFEEDAVRFYSQMVQKATDPETRKAFEELVAFEKGHVATLGNLLKVLQP
ncbi:MAG: ferritin family protein [bacterium]|nr:ferritin family protein [bacterium]